MKFYNYLLILVFASMAGTVSQASEKEGRAYCPKSDQRPDKISIDNDYDSPYVDYNRDLKDFGTNFVVQEFFRTKITLFNFIKITYNTIDSKLKDYRIKNNLSDDSIYFLFKGGNVLRMLANRAFSLLPPAPRELLIKNYAENFKRSDADFSIFIDNEKLSGLDYEKVMTDLSTLTYQALDQLRQEFSREPQKYFDFLRLKKAYANDELDAYFKRIKDLAALVNKDNPQWFQAKFIQMQLLDEHSSSYLRCAYEGQYDYLYEFDSAKPGNIIGIPLTQKPSWIMNSINKTLERFVGGFPKNLVKFYLLRSKVQFEYSYEKDGVLIRRPVGAELIDVSFPHKDDFRLRDFLNHAPEFIANYSITEEASGETIVLKAESKKGLADDLIVAVFEQIRPWEAVKYEKRISRLFFFSILDMLGSSGTGSALGKIYIYEVNEKVLDPLKKILESQSKEDIKKISESIKTNSEDLARDWPDMFTANTIWQHMPKVINEVLLNPKENDRDNFKSFIKITEDNLEVINKLNNMPAYKINIEDIYKVSMQDLF
jgi:hypothetical protein